MRWPSILVFLLLCAVISPALANDPVNLGATLSKDWIIADGTDSSTLTLTVTDGVNKPIRGAEIHISVDKAPWNVKDTVLVTDGNGAAQTLFLPTTRSGTATITISATVPGNTYVPAPRSVSQKIDAGTPYSWRSSYPGVGTVATAHNISVWVGDRNGNPVSSLRTPKAVSFVTGSGGSEGFLDGGGKLVKTIAVALNDTGYAVTTFRLDTKAGDNFVMIMPPAPLIQSLISIRGVPNSQPFSMIQSVSPPGNPPYLLVEDDSASIDYYLYDEWGNPSTDQKILITTSAGEDQFLITNQDGRASMTYGPRNTAGFYTIVATAEENRTVSMVQVLQFASGKASDMLLTASPQTMPSRDVNKALVGHVIAKVIDDNGNPVKGEIVSFQMEKSSSTPSKRTEEPAIENDVLRTTEVKVGIPVETNADGLAVLNFYPGAFPLAGEDKYDPNSQGTVTISATWKGAMPSTIELSYKNYPFLSVYTEVIPKTVQIGRRVDVSVLLKGDGWALQPKPIDVILLTDRSSTMLFNSSVATGRYVEEKDKAGNPTLDDRMVFAMRAGVNFVDQSKGKEDRIAVVSFGSPTGGIAALYDTGKPGITIYIPREAYRAGRDFNCLEGEACTETLLKKYRADDGIYVDTNYEGHKKSGKDYRRGGIEWPVYVESPFRYVATDRVAIKDALRSMVPSGGTNMRQALYESVKMILEDPDRRAGSVKAIILLSDGKWNIGGDPTGVDQSIFSATTYPEVSSGTSPGSVITWAKNNNIKIFTIALLGSDPGDLPNLGQLQDYADETGGKAYVAYSALELDGIYTAIAGALREEASIDTKVALDFSNVEVNSASVAMTDSILAYIPIEDLSTYIVPPSPKGPEWRNDKAVWDATHQLNFEPGTIKVNQEWRMNVTLQPNSEGTIKVLDSRTSSVTFVGTVGSVAIPDTFITAIKAGTEKGPEGITLDIEFSEPPRKNPDSDKKIAIMEWRIDYDPRGRDSRIYQDIWVAPIYSEAYQYRETIFKDRWELSDPIQYPLVISDLRPGLYNVKVVAHASDTNDDFDVATINIPGDVPTPQIRIE